jgi:TrmH family RNA methyltransferase
VEEITSPHNLLIKLVRSLSLRKYREETGLFLAEGLDYARKAMAYDFKPHALFIDSGRIKRNKLRDLIDWCSDQGARVLSVSPPLMQRISALSNPQQVVLICNAKWQPEPVALDERRNVLALHEIRDPGNLGTIMRTAEATAMPRILLVGECCDPYAPESVRASAGSVFAIELTRLAPAAFLRIAAQWMGDVVGTHTGAAESFRQNYRWPVLLLMGSENAGLPPELASACSKLVRIPMAKGIDSLNLATATALMLYELQLPHLTPESHAPPRT